MDPGKLDVPLVLERRVSVRDEAGGVTFRWDVLAPVLWANVAPVSMREVQAQATTEVRYSHRVTVRWRPDLVLDGSVRFRLEGARTPERVGARVLKVVGGRRIGGGWSWMELEVQETEAPSADGTAASRG